MEAKAFVKMWENFSKSLEFPTDPQARVALFGIWFNTGAHERQMKAMGLNSLMDTVGEMLQGTTDDLKRKSKGESWRGDEH